MSDREARVLGATQTITANGKTYTLYPLSMGTLASVQRAALRSYKRQYLETFIDMQSILPEGRLETKLEEVARWDIKNLPQRLACSCKDVPITDAIDEKLVAIFGDVALSQKSTAAKQQLLATAVDREDISTDEIAQLTGVRPRTAYVPYDMWWITAVHEGHIAFVHASLTEGSPNIPLSEVEKWSPFELITAARIVEGITRPAMGNM